MAFEIQSSTETLNGKFRAVVSQTGSLVHRTAKGYPRLLLQLDSAAKEAFASIFSTDVEKLENSAGQTYCSVRLPHSAKTSVDALDGETTLVVTDEGDTVTLAGMAGSMTVDVTIEGAVLRSWVVKNGPMAGERRYEVIGDLGEIRSAKKFSHLDFPPGSFTLEQVHGRVNNAAMSAVAVAEAKA